MLIQDYPKQQLGPIRMNHCTITRMDWYRVIEDRSDHGLKWMYTDNALYRIAFGTHTKRPNRSRCRL